MSPPYAKRALRSTWLIHPCAIHTLCELQTGHKYWREQYVLIFLLFITYYAFNRNCPSLRCKTSLHGGLVSISWSLCFVIETVALINWLCTRDLLYEAISHSVSSGDCMPIVPSIEEPFYYSDTYLYTFQVSSIYIWIYYTVQKLWNYIYTLLFCFNVMHEFVWIKYFGQIFLLIFPGFCIGVAWLTAVCFAWKIAC